jgi:hypothetical protein
MIASTGVAQFSGFTAMRNAAALCGPARTRSHRAGGGGNPNIA